MDAAANVKRGELHLEFLKFVFLFVSQLLSWRAAAQELSSILRFLLKKPEAYLAFGFLVYSHGLCSETEKQSSIA